jgi:hypothetical protein
MKASLDVVFATYSGLPQGDPDDGLVLSLLEAKGLAVAVADWRTVAAPELDSRLIVLRSTWDYHRYYQDFLDWVSDVASRTNLMNVSPLVHWNADKKYLLQLKEQDVPIVPTLYIERSQATNMDAATLTAILDSAEVASAAQIVVKPTVGLSTYGVKCFTRDKSAVPDILVHMASIAASSDVLIQPFLNEVEKNGERALVFLDNQFSHSVRKTAFQKMAVAGDAGETSVVAAADEIAFGQNVLSKLTLLTGRDPLYARVDVVRDDDGQLTLMELELIEPSLFLAWEPDAAERFATAIAATLEK